MRTLLYSLALFIAAAPVVVFGQGQQIYSPLINLQNAGNTAGGFSEYIGFLYGMSISIAALLAVVKIIIAGAKYMLSDVVSSKGSAISDIQGAVLGLLLILGAVIILEFINPQLTKRTIQFDAIQPAPNVSRNANNSATAAPNGGTMTPAQALSQLCTSANGTYNAGRGGSSCVVSNTTPQNCTVLGGTITSSGRGGSTCTISPKPAPPTTNTNIPTSPTNNPTNQPGETTLAAPTLSQRCTNAGGTFTSSRGGSSCEVSNTTAQNCTVLKGTLSGQSRGGTGNCTFK